MKLNVYFFIISTGLYATNSFNPYIEYSQEIQKHASESNITEYTLSLWAQQLLIQRKKTSLISSRNYPNGWTKKEPIGSIKVTIYPAFKKVVRCELAKPASTIPSCQQALIENAIRYIEKTYQHNNLYIYHEEDTNAPNENQLFESLCFSKRKNHFFILLTRNLPHTHLKKTMDQFR